MIKCRYLDWNDALNPAKSVSLKRFLHDEANPDLLLGADLVSLSKDYLFPSNDFLQVYDPSIIPCLLAVISLALKQFGSLKKERHVLIALTVRNIDTLEGFLSTARTWKKSHLELFTENDTI
jgi:hypothetical protein